MEQITREEMIELLDDLSNKLMDATEYPECCGRAGPECCGSPEPGVPDDVLQLVGKAQQYAAALQASESVATLNAARCFSLEDANRVMRLGPGTELFALPCPPAKACEHCSDEGEMETDNNGPIVPCPICQPAKAQVPDEREAFEEWASDYWEFPDAVRRSGDGYALAQTQQYWQAWKARSMLTASPAPDRNADADKRQQEEAER